MQSLFFQVLRLSCSVSLFVAAAVLCRLFLARCSARAKASLWLFVLFRMFCPLDFSFLLPQMTLQVAETTNIVPLIIGASKVNDALQSLTEAVAQPEHTSAFLSAADILACVWVVVTVALLVKVVIETVRLGRKLTEPAQDGVVLQTQINSAFVFGLFRPRIFLPAGLDDAQRAFILTHERAHIRRGDHIVKLLFYVGACIHWFNPLVWFGWRLMQNDMEMACDEAVLNILGEQQKVAYSETVLAFSDGSNAVQAAFAKGSVEKRIKGILRFHKHSKPIVAFAVITAVMCGMMMLCITVSVQADSIVVPISEAAEGIPSCSVDSAAAPQLTWHYPLSESSILSRGFTAGRHEAIDIIAKFGNSVYAAADGTVLQASYDAERGNYVVLQHADSYESHYYHLDSISVTTGDTVCAMTPIGFVGATGNATGTHLHFAVLQNGVALDPVQLLHLPF